jgi:WD40 repeat protein
MSRANRGHGRGPAVARAVGAAALLTLGWLRTPVQAQTGGAPDILWTQGGHEPGLTGGYHSMLTPDGESLVTGGDDGTLKLWRLSDGHLVHSWLAADSSTRPVTVLPDGRTLVTIGYDAWFSGPLVLRYWSLPEGELLRSVENGPRDQRLTVSQDRTLMVEAGQFGSARVWRTADGSLVRTIPSVAWWMTCAFSPDGQLLATSDGIDLHLWRLADGELLRSFGRGQWGAPCLAFSPDGRLLAAGGGAGRTIRLFDANDGSVVRDLDPVPAVSSVLTMVFSPDGETIAASWLEPGGEPPWEEPAVWRVSDGRLLGRLGIDNDESPELMYTSDSRSLVAQSNHVRVWDVPALALRRTFGGWDPIVGPAAYAADGRTVLTGANYRPVAVRAARNGEVLRRFGPAIRDERYCMAMLLDGRQLATNGTRSVRLWDVETGRLVRTLWDQQGQPDWITAADDGSALAWARDGTVHVVDPRGTDAPRELSTAGSVVAVGFLPRSQSLAVLTVDGRLDIRDLQSGATTSSVQLGVDGCWSLTVSLDGRYAAVGSFLTDGALLVGFADGTVTPLHGVFLPCYATAFGTDSRTLIVPDVNNTVGLWPGAAVRIWSVPSGELLACYDQEVPMGCPFVSVSPDGRSILCGRQDGILMAIRHPFPPCAADADLDGSVTVRDLFAFLGDYAQGYSRADLTGDEVVDIQDFLVFLNTYTIGCV